MGSAGRRCSERMRPPPRRAAQGPGESPGARPAWRGRRRGPDLSSLPRETGHCARRAAPRGTREAPGRSAPAQQGPHSPSCRRTPRVQVRSRGCQTRGDRCVKRGDPEARRARGRRPAAMSPAPPRSLRGAASALRHLLAAPGKTPRGLRAGGSFLDRVEEGIRVRAASLAGKSRFPEGAPGSPAAAAGNPSPSSRIPAEGAVPARALRSPGCQPGWARAPSATRPCSGPRGETDGTRGTQPGLGGPLRRLPGHHGSPLLHRELPYPHVVLMHRMSPRPVSPLYSSSLFCPQNPEGGPLSWRPTPGRPKWALLDPEGRRAPRNRAHFPPDGGHTGRQLPGTGGLSDVRIKQ